ncbi:cyclin-D5-1-like [Primulina huaijiensis]|uniref:cyclin-D5-1-like n=1 Tax=Primulina huaijiensis TaxID=1492673 RepID=UPI003CC6E9D3
MEDTETSASSLLCEEDESCLKEQGRYKDETFAFCSVSETDCEHIAMLIQRETIFQSNSEDCAVKSERKWLNSARLDAIKWILDTRARFGFQFGTAYLSLVYFDLFLSRKTIQDGMLWAIRLLSLVCLSLAAKMEESEPHALSKYRVNVYNFEGNMIQRMELLVLTTLEWRMCCVTPFAYLNYFIIKFCGELRHKELATRAAELTLVLMEEINVAEHRPSTVAAAAVLAAYDYGLTRNIVEIKINEVPSLEKEHTFSCYSLLQRIVVLKSKSPKTVVTPYSWSTNSSSIDALDDDARMKSKAGTNRRLNYTDVDEQSSLRKAS